MHAKIAAFMVVDFTQHEQPSAQLLKAVQQAAKCFISLIVQKFINRELAGNQNFISQKPEGKHIEPSVAEVG